MKIEAITRTEGVLKVMLFLAYLAFIGFGIKAGATIISYGVSCFNPEGAKNLYMGLNLYDLSQFSFAHYTLSAFFVAALLIMKALVFVLAIKILSKVNMANPFKIEVARLIQRIGFILLATWAVAMSANAHTDWLLKETGQLHGKWADTEIIFMAGLVFLISQVFKRGVEIQSENELTV